MHVEAGTDPGQLPGGRPGRQEAFRAGEVVFGRHLEILLFSRNQRDRKPGRFGHGGIVGEFAARHGPMRRDDGVVAEGLGRLGPPQAGAVDRPGHLAVIRTLERIDDRHRNESGGTVDEGIEGVIDDAGGNKRPGRVVDQDALGRQARDCLQTVQN